MIPKINDTSTQMIQQYQKNEFTKSEADKQVGAQSAVTEKISLSIEAKDIQRIKQILDQAPDIREEKVLELKNMIDKGNYRVNPGKIAEKIVGDSLINLFA